MAAAALAKTAINEPSLYPEGYGVLSCRLTSEEKSTLRAKALPKDFFRESWKLQQKKFNASRARFLDMKEVDGFLRALAFCSNLSKIKTANKKNTSYNLKHRSEERVYLLDGFVVLQSGYVANGDFIAAAAYSGFSLHPIGGAPEVASPNCYFNISQRSLSDVIMREPKTA